MKQDEQIEEESDEAQEESEEDVVEKNVSEEVEEASKPVSLSPSPSLLPLESSKQRWAVVTYVTAFNHMHSLLLHTPSPTTFTNNNKNQHRNINGKSMTDPA